MTHESINIQSFGTHNINSQALNGVNLKSNLKLTPFNEYAIICFTLSPHFNNYNKRIVKTPKLYFYDTGLLCYLLGINSMDQLDTHPLRGNIFENFVVSEYLKKLNNTGIEIKLSETFHSSFIKNILYLNKLQGDDISQAEVNGNLIYSGESESIFKNIQLNHWLSKLT